VEIKQLLMRRIDTLSGELVQADKWLRAQEIPKRLANRLGRALFDQIDDLRSRLSDAQSVAASLPEGNTPEARSRIKTAWIKFDGLQTEGSRVLVETLAMIQGARSRLQPASLADIADDLLDELSATLDGIAWKRFTFEAEGEAFGENTQVIRLRFPMKDIWNLPVAVHEYGHFLSTVQWGLDEQGGHTIIRELLKARAEGENNKRWFYLNEFFADAVATYALGPAYGYTCLLMRFNPVRAWQETDGRHPPDGQRAALIVRILERMDQEPDSIGDFAGPAQKLKEYWSDSLAAAGQAPDISDVANSKPLDDLVTAIYNKMLKPAGAHLRYNTLKKAKVVQGYLSNASAEFTGTLTLRDLLNAAWRERLVSGVAEQTVNGNFIGLWQRLRK